ncbi:ubiquitin-conjugating enzyme/RWD-like protein [Podospora appendiculata]|uniref:Ubiquitin-conjugating enzyme/RWD-like protein n=1 Tax=Podospora appendiculata TaxID=314037 RepID=A0AAE0X9Z8_9PEZI|nr:ubiquitin-conjugating enzyme/RWD-like protein [Podospora appendiculata]
MTSTKMGGLPSVRRQHLVAEFAGLKQACPNGVFVSLTPGDPSLWSGVLFVRKGPYATAVLRFQISFPDQYPSLPPLVTFSTDLFHPLITPLTTYMYTTDIQDNGTVSATDDERLPPGGFSLRHGFPHWFGRGRRSRQISNMTSSPLQTPPRPGLAGPGAVRSLTSTPTSATSSSTTPGGAPSFMQTTKRDTPMPTFDVLRYIRSTFDDEDVLDSIPLEAAGNPGAWHAWRSYRRQSGKGASGSPDAGNAGVDVGARVVGESALLPSAEIGTATRRPGEWNWEGVWEERSKRGIAASLSEAVLFGSAGAADEVINFRSMDDAEVETVKQNLIRTLGTTA